jgi:exopolysaccharide biosynthesis WecB/TagA/CpsF family protein
MLKDFLKHLFPRVVLERNLAITYTFCLGGLAFTAFLLMLASGMLLLVYYQPTPERAYASILFLESAVWGGAYLRSLHRLSSHAFLILIFLHTLRVLLTGAWHHPRRLNWVIGMLLLFLALFEAYCGYLLPLDQLAYWATQTGMELATTLPFGVTLRDLLVPDGIGVTVAARWLYGVRIGRVPGVDLMARICEVAPNAGYRLFVYGGSEQVNRLAVDRLRARHRDIRIVGREHGYAPGEDAGSLVERINASAADVLFVGLGSPRQERWIERWLPSLRVKVCQGVGGSLDAISGMVPRAPWGVRRVGMEWCYRLVTQPSRVRRQTKLIRFAGEVALARLRRR